MVVCAASLASAGPVSPYIYLNRCSGGCVITGTVDVNNAQLQESSIPGMAGVFTIGEYANADGAIGSAADAEWAQVVLCMQQVYSPYALTVSDVPPPAGQTFTEAIIAGNPSDVGLPDTVLGVSPSSCTPYDDSIAFAFANQQGAIDRVNSICEAAARETGHLFGLVTVSTFVTAYPANGNSTCMDPMGLGGCGGQKFFRNAVANLLDSSGGCAGPQQNSYQQLVDLFGPGTSTTTPPDAAIVYPQDGAIVDPQDAPVTAPFELVASAGAQRGVFNVDLYLNGFKWGTVPGAAFGPEGQPESNYTITWPQGVPNGYIDIVAKAYDDIGVETDSAPITILAGEPCMDAATDCAVGQSCSDGRCAWPAASGQFGDACTYSQFCVNGECEGTPGSQICSTDCDPQVTGSCPAGYECAVTSDSAGFCLATSSGGCSTSQGCGGWVPAGLGAIVLGIRLRRRKPPRSRSTIER